MANQVPFFVSEEIAAKMQNKILRILSPARGEQFTAFAKAETAKWAKVVKAAGIKLD